VAAFAVSVCCFAGTARADTVTYTAEFGMPNEVMIDGGGTPFADGGPGDVWHVSGSNFVYGGAGPTQFHPDWGTLTGVTIEVVGSIRVEWDVSNPYYGWNGGSGFWATIGFGDPANIEDTKWSVIPEPTSASGEFHFGIQTTITDLELSQFVGTDAVDVMLTSRLGYVFEADNYEDHINDPLADISGAAQGMFVGQIIVTYEYIPND